MHILPKFLIHRYGRSALEPLNEQSIQSLLCGLPLLMFPDEGADVLAHGTVATVFYLFLQELEERLGQRNVDGSHNTRSIAHATKIVK